MKQSKVDSVKEVVCNTGVGMIGSWLLTMCCLMFFTTPVGIATSTTIACTVWSLGRVYQKAMETWEWNSMSVGGWKVFFYPHDDTYGTIEVLVDPAVSKDTNFVYI